MNICREGEEMPMSGEGFLSRWSRRKVEERRGDSPVVEAPEAPPTGGEDVASGPAEPLTTAPDVVPVPDELSREEIEALPPVEDVATADELKRLFLRKGVPGLLRNAALRRIWAMNPAISNYVDVARDYAYDWNVPGGVPGNGGSLLAADAKALAARLLGGASEDEAEHRPDAETVATSASVTDDLPFEEVAHEAPEAIRKSEPEAGHTAVRDEGESKPLVVADRLTGIADEREDVRVPSGRRHGRAAPR
jgi:hypothetical protein